MLKYNNIFILVLVGLYDDDDDDDDDEDDDD